MSSTKRPISKVANKKQDKKMSYKIKRRTCYTYRGKGHLSIDCPMGNTPKLNSLIDSNLLRRPKNDTCARKVIGSPYASTNAIWVPKSFMTNLDGPKIVWVPSCAWWSIIGTWRWYKTLGCLCKMVENIYSSYQSIHIIFSYMVDLKMNQRIYFKLHTHLSN
jgi:hypothetical protein